MTIDSRLAELGITLPAHLNINTLELMPVSQSWAGFAVERNL